MRESNAYHKYNGEGQKADGELFETLKFPVTFNYYDELGSSDVARSMFKGFEFKASSTKLITENIQGLTVNDRLWIDDNPSLINAVHSAEKQTMGGQRWKIRKKIYVIELEV